MKVTRHLDRYRQLLSILLSYGFENLAKSIDRHTGFLTTLIGIKKEKISIEGLSRGARIRKMIEELGTTFIKLSQLLSTRPDLIPEDIANELSLLQDKVFPLPFEVIKSSISKELGTSLDHYFKTIDEAPIAAGSIAQVHRAVLNNGDEVIIKVQRPGIEKKILVDLEILKDLSIILEDHNRDFAIHQPSIVVDEFARTIKRELDFTVEESNILHFEAQSKQEMKIRVPRVYTNLTTKKIICMEYIRGVKPDKEIKKHFSEKDRKEIASAGVDSVMRQIFINGFFHADPHPGNIIIDNNATICFIDFGMIGRINKKDRQAFSSLLRNLSVRNDRRISETILTFTNYRVKPEINLFERSVTDLLDYYLSKPLEKIDYSQLFSDIMEFLSHFGLALQPRIYLMLKALVSVESVGRVIDPEFQLSHHLNKFAKTILYEQFNPKNLSNEILNSMYETKHFILNVHKDVAELLSKAKNNELSIGMEHHGYEDMLNTFDRVSNRIVFAIIQASIIIGSSLIIHADIPPYWNKIPIIGLTGFILAGILGIIILLQMIKRNKL